MSKDVWLNANKENAGDLILTGYEGDFKDMPVYDEVRSLFGSGSTALDFGCGVGRNSVALSDTYDKVISFDLPSMIGLVPEDNKLSNITYTTDWEHVKSFKFDILHLKNVIGVIYEYVQNDIKNPKNRLGYNLKISAVFSPFV